MEITELVWKLFLLLLPGVVASLMLNQISSNRTQSVLIFIINSALFGIATFLIMELFVSLYHLIVSIFSNHIKIRFGLNLSIWGNLFDNKNEINKIEILISYLLSIPLGVFYGFIYSKKLINKLFQKLRLTHRYGDDDVWSFFFNSPDTKWVLVRDKQINITYYGSVRAYSDTNEKREILLNEVDVYTTDKWEFLYKSDAVFLELDNNNYSIEIPNTEENGNNKKNSKRIKHKRRK